MYLPTRKQGGENKGHVSRRSRLAMTKQTPSFCSIARDEDSDEACPGQPTSNNTLGAIPSFTVSPVANNLTDFGRPSSTTSPRGRQARQAFAKCRPASKDLLDDYLHTKREARRRSSCKEIILQLLRTDTAETPDSNEPKFHLIERQRRLTIANKLFESFAESEETLPDPVPNPFGSLTDTLCAYDEKLEKSPLRIRSHSADTYDATEVKVKANETKAFLFDSDPDLQDSFEKESFTAARRHRRRGAVWQSETERDVRLLLEKLKLNREIANDEEAKRNKSQPPSSNKNKKMQVNRKAKLGQLGRSFSIDVPD